MQIKKPAEEMRQLLEGIRLTETTRNFFLKRFNAETPTQSLIDGAAI